MNTLFTKIRDKHALWYKGFVFLFCVIVCAYLLPKHKYIQIKNISRGDVWLNDDLVSPFDFLVKKNDRIRGAKIRLKTCNTPNDKKMIPSDVAINSII